MPTGRKRKVRTTGDEPSAKRIQSAALAANFGADEGTAVARAPLKNPDACLGQLPTEPLINIVGYLPRRSLSRLSQVSRELYGVAVSPLYEKGISAAMSERCRHGLVSTINKKAELAKMVKSIEAVYTVDLTDREVRLLDFALYAATDVQKLSIKDVSRSATLRHTKHDFRWLKLLVNTAKGTPVELAKTFVNLKTLNISLGIHISG